MNLSPTDRDKLQAYLDALRAVPAPDLSTDKMRVLLTTLLITFANCFRYAEREMQ